MFLGDPLLDGAIVLRWPLPVCISGFVPKSFFSNVPILELCLIPLCVFVCVCVSVCVCVGSSVLRVHLRL